MGSFRRYDLSAVRIELLLILVCTVERPIAVTFPRPGYQEQRLIPCPHSSGDIDILITRPIDDGKTHVGQ